VWRRRSPDQRVHRSPLQGRLPRQGHTSTREVFSTYVARRREHLAHLRRHHGTTGARRRPTRRTGRLRETSIWGGDSAHPFTSGTTSWPSLVPTDPFRAPQGEPYRSGPGPGRGRARGRSGSGSRGCRACPRRGRPLVIVLPRWPLSTDMIVPAAHARHCRAVRNALAGPASLTAWDCRRFVR
jgi:hypothetical protein